MMGQKAVSHRKVAGQQEKETGKMPLVVFRKLTTCETEREQLLSFVAFSFCLLCLFERAVTAHVATAAPLTVSAKFYKIYPLLSV